MGWSAALPAGAKPLAMNGIFVARLWPGRRRSPAMAQRMEQRSGWAMLQRRSPGGRQGKRSRSRTPIRQ